MAWTREQENAINARGCSLLVSAAAGSGKTSVLVERLIRILSDSENRVPADRMIVVTFTKDAAAEMKQRLTAALASLIEKEPENNWLNEQQLLLQSAKISTIHSFCFELIRDNIQELELTGSFRIMDETESELMISGAISDIVTEYYEKHPEMTGLLYDQFCSRDDSAIVVLKMVMMTRLLQIFINSYVHFLMVLTGLEKAAEDMHLTERLTNSFLQNTAE